MLDLSMGEIGVIAAIALVVLGPDKLPQVAKTAGSLMGKAQRFVSQVKNDIDKEVELSELKKIQEDAKKMASDLQSSLKNTTDSIEKQVSDVRDSVTSAGQEVKSTMDNASKELKDQWMESTAPKAELSMENIVDGTAKTETASASTGLGKDAAWENLDKSVDTSMLEKAFDWGASDIKPTLPQELSGPAPTVESYNFGPTRKLFNRLAGKKLMQTFGGKIVFFGIGGSKIDPVVERFLREAKFPYAIGYGLTETSPMSAGSAPRETFLQGVGPAMEGVQIKINEPDKTGQGEIWIKGPHVMKGYYKKPELTQEVFSEDGWFKTGDLGSFDRKGRLSIRGRIKTMILGSSGENIYPEEIESIINNFRFVNESLVVESKGKLVAMVHFNMEELEKQVQKIKSQAGNYKTAINDYIEEQKKELFEYVNSRVNNFSKLQLVLVQHEPFEKTPTHKIKRFLYNNINIK